MGSFRFYLEFYKSHLILNWAISIAFAFLLTPSFLTGLPIMLMTAGPITCIFFQEFSRKKEYFFYYNRGITKLELLLSFLILNIITGAILLPIMSLCRILLK